MAVLAPFRGLRFNPEKIAHLEDVVTPPYDVINERTQGVFEQRNAYNMIKLDISKSPGLAIDSEERYSRASNFFKQWQAENVLIRDDAPTIYLYLTDYSLPSGRRLIRRGFVALVRLADFSEGIVKPHEETFSTVTSDRLRLLAACQAQFSQIFGFYSDARGEVMAALEQAVGSGAPLASVRDADGASHRIWPVSDPACLAAVQHAFTGKAIYIADGHHRYSTALRYREEIRKRNGGLVPEGPYNYVMMYLCAMEDPGLSVLPTHRLLYLPADSALGGGGKTLAGLSNALAPAFELEEVKSGSREALIEEVLARMEDRRQHTTMFGLYHAGEDRCLLLALKDGAMELSKISRHPALAELDVVVLSDLVVDRILGLDHRRCEEANLIHYYSEPDEALDAAIKASAANNSATPLLFLMNHTRVAQVKQVADERLFMPHKSTFFYPKLLTGLLINKLT